VSGYVRKGIRKFYRIVPQAITAFLESNDFEDAIRKAISIGVTATPLPALQVGSQRLITEKSRII